MYIKKVKINNIKTAIIFYFNKIKTTQINKKIHGTDNIKLYALL